MGKNKNRQNRKREEISEESVIRMGKPVNLILGLAVILYAAANTNLMPSAVNGVLYFSAVPLMFSALGGKAEEGGLAEADEKSLILRLCRIFIVPYFWFSLIKLVTNAAMMLTSNGWSLDDMRSAVIETVTFYGGSELWFLTAAFVAFVIYSVLRNKINVSGLLPITLFTAAAVAATIQFANIRLSNIVWDSENTLMGAGARVAMVFLRSVFAMYFISLGAFFSTYLKKVKYRKIKLSIPGFLLVGVSVALGLITQKNISWATLNAEGMLPGMLFSSLVVCGAWCLAVWIENISVINFIGRNAFVVFLTLNIFGSIALARKIGNELFTLTENNFVQRSTVAIVLLAACLAWIYVFKIPWFDFIKGIGDEADAFMMDKKETEKKENEKIENGKKEIEKKEIAKKGTKKKEKEKKEVEKKETEEGEE